MALTAAVLNVLYATFAIGFVVVITMMSAQFQNSDTSSPDKKKTGVSRIVDAARASLEESRAARSGLKATLLAQKSTSLMQAARTVASDEDIEKETAVIVRNLHDEARRHLSSLIGSLTKPTSSRRTVG